MCSTLTKLALPFFVAALTLGFAERLLAATQPSYGGTLVVELRSPSLVLDPAKWKTGSPEASDSMQIAAAIFDRLITLDRYGRLQPALATDWSHDAQFRRWQFSVRPGVLLSDGSLLTSSDIADALRELLPGKPTITASTNRVVLQFPTGVPDLLEQLASGRFFIFRRNANGTLIGTGSCRRQVIHDCERNNLQTSGKRTLLGRSPLCRRNRCAARRTGPSAAFRSATRENGRRGLEP